MAKLRDAAEDSIDRDASIKVHREAFDIVLDYDGRFSAVQVAGSQRYKALCNALERCARQ